MYSTTIKPKVDEMFSTLRLQVSSIVNESSTPNDAVDNVTKLVSSELATRSKSILSDMLFSLSDELMETDFFSDLKRQNRFSEINLRQEILSKYQFAPSATIDYHEASSSVAAMKMGGAVFVAGGIAEIGVVLIKGLTLSDLIPIPISLLLAASIGAALADYYAIEPEKNRKSLARVLDIYLVDTEQQFLRWFDEVEKYFNVRVEEIKQTL